MCKRGWFKSVFVWNNPAEIHLLSFFFQAWLLTFAVFKDVPDVIDITRFLSALFFFKRIPDATMWCWNAGLLPSHVSSSSWNFSSFPFHWRCSSHPRSTNSDWKYLQDLMGFIGRANVKLGKETKQFASTRGFQYYFQQQKLPFFICCVLKFNL